MDVIFKNAMNGKEGSAGLDELVTTVLTTTDYDTRGEAEMASEVASNCAKMLGKLIDALAHKGMLDDQELNDIVTNYRIENIRHI